MLKRVLIIGGAGFLGSHLCKRLLNQGHNVICLDNFYSSEKDNILSLIDNPNFSFTNNNSSISILHTLVNSTSSESNNAV